MWLKSSTTQLICGTEDELLAVKYRIHGNIRLVLFSRFSSSLSLANLRLGEFKILYNTFFLLQ